jgi:hypothetical protein
MGSPNKADWNFERRHGRYPSTPFLLASAWIPAILRQALVSAVHYSNVLDRPVVFVRALEGVHARFVWHGPSACFDAGGVQRLSLELLHAPCG